MKTILPTLLVLLTANIHAQEFVEKLDGLQKVESGKGVCQWTGTLDPISGNLSKSDFIDASGNLKFTLVPVYSNEGRLLETRRYDSSGKLLEVIVIIGKREICLTPDGAISYNKPLIDPESIRDHIQPNSSLVRIKKRAEQDGAEQPASTPESKPKGEKKPKPESEGRSQ